MQEANTTPVEINLPEEVYKLRSLRAGEEVLISGVIYTMRDAGHQRCLQALEQTGELPFGLSGHTIFYAGPTPANAGRPLGSIGPTTSSRMDFAAPQLFEAGVVATIGKGKRSSAIKDACKKYGCVHFSAIGGVAALLATHVVDAAIIAWEDLGTEALMKLKVDRFPAFVGIDSTGVDIFDLVLQDSSNGGVR